MSEYIPTTEEIRNGYLCSLSTTELWNDADGRWDRWLAEVKAQAWQDGWHAKDTDVNPYRQGEEQ